MDWWRRHGHAVAGSMWVERWRRPTYSSTACDVCAHSLRGLAGEASLQKGASSSSYGDQTGRVWRRDEFMVDPQRVLCDTAVPTPARPTINQPHNVRAELDYPEILSFVQYLPQYHLNRPGRSPASMLQRRKLSPLVRNDREGIAPCGRCI